MWNMQSSNQRENKIINDIVVFMEQVLNLFPVWQKYLSEKVLLVSSKAMCFLHWPDPGFFY